MWCWHGRKGLQLPSRLEASCRDCVGRAWGAEGEGAGGPGLERGGPWGSLSTGVSVARPDPGGQVPVFWMCSALSLNHGFAQLAVGIKLNFSHSTVEDHNSVMRWFGNGFSWALDSNCLGEIHQWILKRHRSLGSTPRNSRVLLVWGHSLKLWKPSLLSWRSIFFCLSP